MGATWLCQGADHQFPKTVSSTLGTKDLRINPRHKLPKVIPNPLAPSASGVSLPASGEGSAFCFLLFAFCFLLFAFCFLLFAFCFLLSAFCFLLFAFCFLLFAFRSCGLLFSLSPAC